MNTNPSNNISKMNRDISNGVTQMYCGSIGQSLFMSMGYLCVIFLLLEFIAILTIKEDGSFCRHFQKVQAAKERGFSAA